MFHGLVLLTLLRDKRQLESQCLFQVRWRQKYPEAGTYNPFYIYSLLGRDQEPVRAPATLILQSPQAAVQPGLGPELDLQCNNSPVPVGKEALYFHIRKVYWK